MLIFQWLLVLLVCAVVLTGCAKYLKIPYPSLLALGGTALALIPSAPVLKLDPQLTLALFVPPVLLDGRRTTTSSARFGAPLSTATMIFPASRTRLPL